MSKLDVAIVGGGISGLAALHYLRTLKPDRVVRLFEAEEHLGGTIGTDQIDGYSFDWGPNGFLDREPLTLRLCHELGLDSQLERANSAVNNRFILRKGKLRAVPMTPPSFLASDILSLSGRLRVLREPLVGRSAQDGDESVYDFVARRIGREAADYLVQPMVSGIFGGLAEKLSLRACFPIMHEMEQEHGSLIKAMIARAGKAKAEGREGGGPSGPAGWLTSFRGGLNCLVRRFEERYRDQIDVCHAVRSVHRTGDGYTLTLGDGTTHAARAVILALPAYHASELVAGLSPRLSQALAQIHYAPIAVVGLGYASRKVRHSLDGFGFLVPRLEKRRILGSIWTSSIFSDRAPDGRVQLRTMVGGDGDHESIALSDDELVTRVREDLDDILGISGEPEVVKVYRWKRGIPQFHIGHTARLRTIEAELSNLQDLHVTGNAYYGIGLNDCVKQSWRVVAGME